MTTLLYDGSQWVILASEYEATIAEAVYDVEEYVDEPVFTCPKCPRTFSTHKGLLCHVSRRGCSRACEPCHKRFPTKEDFERHMSMRHDKNQ